MSATEWATIIYVLGEVVISLVAMAGALWVMFYSPDQGVKLAASGVLTGVMVFWFQRRGAEQSTNTVATLANGKMDAVIAAQRDTATQLANLSGQGQQLAASIASVSTPK